MRPAWVSWVLHGLVGSCWLSPPTPVAIIRLDGRADQLISAAHCLPGTASMGL